MPTTSDAPDLVPDDAPVAAGGAAALGEDEAAYDADGAAAASDVADVLALVAQMEATAFLRFAAAAAEATDPLQRLSLSRLAGASLARQETLLERTGVVLGSSELALDRFVAFEGAFDEFHARTRASGWWEELLKGYVGHGVAYDFCRIVAEALDETSRRVVVEAIDGELTSEQTVELVDAATDADEQLAARLALWGRRLVGEALSAVQVLLTENAALGRLLARAVEARFAGTGDAVPAVATSWLFGQLTAEHARRMSRIGLAA